MTKDQVKLLREEASGPHALFHQFALLQSRSKSDSHFLFFEGADDPSFYIGHISRHLNGREYYEFCCNGREGVIKIHELCARDGRASGRTLFFLDKDLTDILDEGRSAELPSSIYQTSSYSFENYIVCTQVFRRFWAERLHLSVTDTRYENFVRKFEQLHLSFAQRMRLLMALMLVTQGIEGEPITKLNLNNLNLEKVLRIDVSSERVQWTRNAWQYFITATALRESGGHLRVARVKQIYRKYLQHLHFKQFIRGKYELWFFIRFLAQISRQLSDKQHARETGFQRATPGEIINNTNGLDSLCGLPICPPDLDAFLNAHLK